MNRRKSRCFLMALMVMSVGFSGCLGGEEEDVIRIAFSVKDDYDAFDENPQRLATYLSEATGLNVELYAITSDTLALEALRFGSADMAFLDGGAAWMGWQQYGLEAMMANTHADGRTYYEAQAWVLNDSEAGRAATDGDDATDPFEVLAGSVTCHTGWLKSAGMLIPMGYFIGQGYADVVGDVEDIESLRSTIFNHFSPDAVIPESGTLYYGYGGALRCLSEGEGSVAFVKDTSVDSYCATDDAERASWCLDREAYIPLPAFGQAPTHPLMYQPDSVSNADREALVQAFLALNTTDEGRSILANILNTQGLVETTSQTHLGSYAALIQHVPGITGYFNEQYSEA